MSPAPTRSSRNRRAPLVALALVLAAGCATETRDVRPSPAPRPPAPQQPRGAAPPSNASNLDPCAMRLHDLCGALFLYYFTYQRLPARLEELNTFPGAEAQVPLECPETKQPYVYTPDGILLAERKTRVVIYDPTPAHYGGRRWAVSIDDPTDEKPMVAKVIVLPESFFLLRPPTAP